MADAAPAAGVAADAGTAGGAGDQGAAPEQATPDFQQLIGDATAPLQQELESMRGLLESYAPAQEAQPGQQPGYEQFGQPAAQPHQQPGQPDLSYLDPSSPNYDEQAAARAFLETVQQQQQQQLNPLASQVQQLSTQLADMRADGEYRQLAEEFPDLADQQISDKVFEAATQWTGQLVQSGMIPQESAQAFAESAPVLRAVYMMGRAAELANAEGQPQPGAASLEGAGGGAPAAPAGGGMTAESILGAGRASVLPI